MAIALDTWDNPPERLPGDFRHIRKVPLVSDPDGATVKSGARAGEIKWVRYGRPSSFGKDIENTYNLQRWNEREEAAGFARWLTCMADPQLNEDDVVRTMADALERLAQAEPDTDERDEAADAVVAQAKALSKAGLAADRGTHMHLVTEDDDTEQDWARRAEDGEVLGIPVHVQAAMLEAFRLCCVAYGFETLDVERKVVHDRWRQAGTLDRRVRLTRDITFANGVTLPAGLVILVDLKTGKLYTEDRKTKRRKLRTEQGYWNSYSVQCVTYADGVPYDCDTDTRGEWDEPMSPDWAIIMHLPVDEALAGKAVCRLVLVDLNAARTVVEEVILKAKEWQAKRDLFAFTHPDEPAIEIPIEEPEQSGEELPEVDNTLVERLTASINQAISNRPRVEDEGPYIAPQLVDDLKARVKQLEPAAREVLNALARESAHAERPFSIADPYRRRWNIYRSLLRLADEFGADLCEDHIRATVALVLPEIHHPGTFLGTAIGALSLGETEALVAATLRVVGGQPSLTFDEAGRPSWAGVNPAA